MFPPIALSLSLCIRPYRLCLSPFSLYLHRQRTPSTCPSARAQLPAQRWFSLCVSLSSIVSLFCGHYSLVSYLLVTCLPPSTMKEMWWLILQRWKPIHHLPRPLPSQDFILLSLFPPLGIIPIILDVKTNRYSTWTKLFHVSSGPASY